MSTIRVLYRIFRALVVLYALVQAARSSRWFFITLALLRVLQKRTLRYPGLVKDIAFVDGSDPVYYKRAGWRTIVPQRVGKDTEPVS